jgi:hypothetical protein
MDEYISKHEPIEEIKRIYCTSCNSYNGAMCRACEHQDDIDIIEDTKAADVQPIRRGEWEAEHYNELIECYEAYCSECGYESTDKYKISESHRYCERCGADMTGGQRWLKK